MGRSISQKEVKNSFLLNDDTVSIKKLSDKLEAFAKMKDFYQEEKKKHVASHVVVVGYSLEQNNDGG